MTVNWLLYIEVFTAWLEMHRIGMLLPNDFYFSRDLHDVVSS